MRGDTPEKAFGGGTNDKLTARGELGAAFARLVAEGLLQVETGFRVSHVGLQEAATSHRSGLGLLRPSRRGG